MLRVMLQQTAGVGILDAVSQMAKSFDRAAPVSAADAKKIDEGKLVDRSALKATLKRDDIKNESLLSVTRHAFVWTMGPM